MKRVLLAPKARSFLLSEASYLRSHSRLAADRFLTRIREARRALGRFDELGFPNDALPVPGLRRLIVGDYVLDYVPGDPVMVIAMRHGRQSENAIINDDVDDFEERFFDNGRH